MRWHFTRGGHREPSEQEGGASSGAVFVVVEVVLVVLGIAAYVGALQQESLPLGLLSIVLLLAALVVPAGFIVIQPDVARTTCLLASQAPPFDARARINPGR